MLVKKIKSTILRLIYDIVDENTLQYIVSVLDNPVQTEITSTEYGNLIKLITHTGGETLTTQEQKYVIDAFEKLFVSGTNLWVVECYSQAGVDVKLTKETGDDWDGFIITAREDANVALVSTPLAGTSATSQTISLPEISLAGDTIFKIKIGLEGETEGSPDGDVVRVVDDFFLLVKENGTDV